jgi:2,4-dienoyl-CoA reductase-like NADH-dependent reductase (Old Yellow Enzyme family)/thioredoxin reductase
MSQFPHLFEPIELGKVRLRNRIMMTAHGRPVTPARYVRYVEERAKGGVAMVGILAAQGIMTYPVTPAPNFPLAYAADPDAVLPNPTTPEGIAFFDKTAIPNLKALSDVVHKHGAVCFGQLHHLGASKTVDNLQPPLAPSAVPDDFHHQVPHELEEFEIAELVQSFKHGARRVKAAGMDGIEIHCGHFYLINQFLSPYTNKRTDKYGGSFENRMRFLQEVLDVVVGQVGTDMPIGIRMNGHEFVEGGLTIEDMQKIAQTLESRLAYFSVSGGTYTGVKKGSVRFTYVPPWFIPDGPMVPYAAAIKKVVKKPVMVVGRITDPHHAERIIAEGSADMVGLTRALIADPNFARKAQEGRVEDMHKCTGNNECHVMGRPITCTINPTASREDEMELKPAVKPGRVLVAGGGPAGMEAARIAARRGHEIILCERLGELGGQVAYVARDPNRTRLGEHVAHLQRDLEKHKVQVRLNTEVTPALVEELRPDAVVVATGADPYVPQVPGVADGRVFTSLQVLAGSVQAGKRVLVVGGVEGHLPPLTTGEFLADQGKTVEIISDLAVVGEDLDLGLRYMYLKRLAEKGIKVTPGTSLRAVKGRAVVVADIYTGREREIKPIDMVVLACGSRADDRLARLLRGKVANLYTIGDCRAPRRMLHAVLEGARVGRVV